MSKDRRLGRGLAALLGGIDDEPQPLDPPAELEHAAPPAPQPAEQHTPTQADPSATAAGEELVRLPVEQIEDNPFQPRRDFSEPEIVSLAESLKEHDMLQPILVRRIGDRHQLISGERRLRAAIQAGWTTVPVRVREADDRLVAELAIVENLQRKDLNPIEKALSFRRYLDQHECTQEDLARRLKIDRSTIANLLRLLELPEAVRDALGRGDVSAGHARALLPLGEESLQIQFCEEIRREGKSVRETERMVQERIQQEDGQVLEMAAARRKRTRNEQIASLEQELRTALGAKVEIRQSARGRGRIVIQFHSHEEFNRLRSLLIGGDANPAVTKAG